MKLLLHICCAPCACHPLDRLSCLPGRVTGFWYNPNIHPWTEYRKRLDGVETLARLFRLELLVRDDYDLEGFLRAVAHDPVNRCLHCYRSRLEMAAHAARDGGFSHFTSTLLYSRYQNHGLIRSLAESISRSVGIPFLYEDWRSGWQEGIRRSKELSLYRQQYCGCIYSEKERYLGKDGGR